ncbi:alpha/beta fold hydrolase [Nonomuraea ceibae]|uniref:alpha/beta fold hydrolase n=1 Tax=Nonomuraea ceibae TaxID=1935170 RepID=UPI0027DF6467|nr:alpha/beta hydrolase [Nonomuraea ceibae]
MDTTRSPDGTSIAYDRAGTGPAVVLVDAACCFRGFGPMRQLAELLTGDFTVFTYDRRGRGDSTDTEPYAVRREVEDLQAVIEAAGGAAAVYGFSSGAVLALHAAAAGVTISRLALLEPPVILQDVPAPPSDLEAELAELIAAGRRGDAIEHFHRGIGVPEAMVAGLRQDPAWPALADLAHTLAYDLRVTGSMTTRLLSTVTVPTLVIDSTGSDQRLRTWAVGVAAQLPDSEHRTLPGEWHGPASDTLAATLTDFLATAVEPRTP